MSTTMQILMQATQPAEQPWLVKNSFFIMMGVLLLMMWLMVFRPRKQEERRRREMLDNLKRGDRVQTIGGILGTVVEARETEVLLKVDESSNTKVHFARSAIHRVLEPADKPQANGK